MELSLGTWRVEVSYLMCSKKKKGVSFLIFLIVLPHGCWWYIAVWLNTFQLKSNLSLLIYKKNLIEKKLARWLSGWRQIHLLCSDASPGRTSYIIIIFLVSNSQCSDFLTLLIFFFIFRELCMACWLSSTAGKASVISFALTENHCSQWEFL